MRRYFTLLIVLLCAVLFAVPLMAQDHPSAAAGAELCVAYGALIAIGVSILKRFPFGIGGWIASHPKVCATVLSGIAALAPLLKGSGLTIAQLAVCIGAYFAGSQGMYQGILKPVGQLTGIQADPFHS